MNVLFATDGSNEARAAATWLSRLPFSGARLDIATVAPENSLEPAADAASRQPRPGSPEEAQWVQAQAMAEELSAAFAEVRPHLLAGRPAAQILTLARIAGADLIVLGHRERSAVAETVLGSVSREVVSRAPCPVLLVRAGSRIPRRALVSFDGSAAARRGLAALLQLPLPAETDVTVMTVAVPLAPEVPLIDVYGAAGALPPEYYEEVDAENRRRAAAADAACQEAARSIEASGRRVSRKVVTGVARDEIVAAAKAQGADLVVIGAHTRRGWAPDVLGNTARAVIHGAPCAVLIGSAPPPTPAPPTPETGQAESGPEPPKESAPPAGLEGRIKGLEDAVAEMRECIGALSDAIEARASVDDSLAQEVKRNRARFACLEDELDALRKQMRSVRVASAGHDGAAEADAPLTDTRDAEASA